MKRWTMVAVLFALTVVVARADIKYALTSDNTTIEWVGTKAEGKHTGGFKKVSGTATLSDKTGLKIEVEIDTASLHSDNAKLTGHLKSPDFFAVKDHPKAKFVSTKIEKGTKGYTITGDLTMLGKTKSITFPAEVTAGETLKVKGEAKINRNDFGMTYGKGKINDTVIITVKVDAKK